MNLYELSSMGPVELLARSAQAAAETSAGVANSPSAIMFGAAFVSAGIAYALGWRSGQTTGLTFPSAAMPTRPHNSGWRNGLAPRGGGATEDLVMPGVALAVIGVAPVVIAAVGAGLNDEGAGTNDGGAELGVDPEQAVSGTLARMPSTITNRPWVRTVRV